MRAHAPSVTAQRVAIRRAEHQLVDRPPVFADPLALSIVGPRAAAAIAAGTVDRPRRAPHARGHPVSFYVLTRHAAEEMVRRELSPQLIASVLAAPGERFKDRRGRDVLQSVITLGNPPRPYVVRVIVDIGRTPPEVVTAYRSSKIAKYWRGVL